MRLRAPGVTVKLSQSRLGCEFFWVIISTISPFFQRPIQRHHSGIDSGSGAAVAHLGVNAVGKVNWGRALRQGNHVAVGREHIDIIVEQVALDALQIFMGVFEVALPVEKLSAAR